MKDIKNETGKKFVQVSLSSEFAADLRIQAEVSHRSMASQLEHWAKIARAVETVIPATTLGELKNSKDPSEVLSRVGAYLLNQNPVSLKARLAIAKSPRYGVDENDPEVVIRIDPDGTQTRGKFDVAGNFVAVSAATQRMQRNDQRSEPKKPRRKTPERPAAARSRSSKGRSGHSAIA